MKLFSLIVDDFFPDPRNVREALLKLPYAGFTNPQDAVYYPDVAKVPAWIAEEIKIGIAHAMNPICPPFSEVWPEIKIPPFARLSLSGNQAPHQAHTDVVMGELTAIIYMSLPGHYPGGTQIVEHVDGMKVHPQTQDEVKLWAKDTNNFDMWNEVGGAAMKFNRLFVLPSNLFHRAMPIGGFGNCVENGRLVIGTFFK